jgi:tetratricopeptide (TPR) repeat protein
LSASEDPADINQALDLLQQARKESPQTSMIYYNMAVCYVKLGQFDTALDKLEQAKAMGDFATEEDIRYFRKDKDFEPLRKSGEPNHQLRLTQLLRR